MAEKKKEPPIPTYRYAPTGQMQTGTEIQMIVWSEDSNNQAGAGGCMSITAIVQPGPSVWALVRLEDGQRWLHNLAKAESVRLMDKAEEGEAP